MSGERIRFLHTAEFHLEQPLYGLSKIPDHLQELLIDAPYVAARQVFETAILEQVDFLVIAGDVADIAKAGPRAIAFLEEQFQLLAERDIRAYWAGGQADLTDNWTRQLQLPTNVHLFTRDSVEQVVHLRDGKPIMAIRGASWNGTPGIDARRYHAESIDNLPTIAVAFGEPDDQAKQMSEIGYWALGGRHQRRKSPHHWLVQCGTPQGRCPKEPGEHGCTLVEMNKAGEIRTKSIATDAARFQTIEISLTTRIELEEFEQHLLEEVQTARQDANGRPLFVTCRVFDMHQLKTDDPVAPLSHELCDRLNEKLGKATPQAWTLAVQFDPPDEFPESWYQEATILGDFLRSIRDDDDDDETLDDLVRYLSDRQKSAGLDATVRLDDAQVRSQVLRKSALLGAELLRGKRDLDLTDDAKPGEYVL